MMTIKIIILGKKNNKFCFVGNQKLKIKNNNNENNYNNQKDQCSVEIMWLFLFAVA